MSLVGGGDCQEMCGRSREWSPGRSTFVGGGPAEGSGSEPMTLSRFGWVCTCLVSRQLGFVGRRRRRRRLQKLFKQGYIRWPKGRAERGWRGRKKLLSQDLGQKRVGLMVGRRCPRFELHEEILVPALTAYKGAADSTFRTSRGEHEEPRKTTPGCHPRSGAY